MPGCCRLSRSTLLAASLAISLGVAEFSGGHRGLRAAGTEPCAPLQAQRPIPPPAATQHPDQRPDHGPDHRAAGDAGGGDYRHRLQPTPLGWARLDHWCVWIEPGAQDGPAALWDGRWRQAVDGALERWRALLPITVVNDPARAQVRLLRRKPPLQNQRASHGRAILALVEVRRGQPDHPIGPWQVEPQVFVLLSPGQGLAAMQATALHELGHAFGLWGHSDQAGDALAATPGSRPVLELSARDRATLRWLQAQPGLVAPGAATPAAAPPGAPPTPVAPGAN